MAANHTINEPSSTSRPRPRRLLLTAASLLIAASCSGGSDATTPTVLLTSTAPTTVATTTTTEATTTTEDPAIAHERDVAEITEVYERMRHFLSDFGIPTSPTEVDEFAVDPVRQNFLDTLNSWQSQGFTIGSGTYEVHILDISVSDDFATLTSCNLDAVPLVTSDGQEVIPADDSRFLRTTILNKTTDGWLVAESGFTNDEMTTCEV